MEALHVLYIDGTTVPQILIPVLKQRWHLSRVEARFAEPQALVARAPSLQAAALYQNTTYLDLYRWH